MCVHSHSQPTAWLLQMELTRVGHVWLYNKPQSNTQIGELGWLSGSDRLMIKRSRVRVPAGKAGGFSSPELTLILVSVPLRVTSVACKRSRSFCQKCRWQVKAKHTCILHMQLQINDTVNWCMVAWGTQNLHWDSSSFTRHQLHNNQTAP